MRRAEKKAEAGVGRGGSFGEDKSWSEMEVVRCPEHGRRSGSKGPRGLPAYRGVIVVDLLSLGTLCLLKTGVREGPNKGKSFYVCRADTCSFVRATE